MINLLGVPQSHFGITGIRTCNRVNQKLQDKGFQTQYNPIARKITILNSSDLPQSVLHEILLSSEYVGWHPIIEKERNDEENLEVRLNPTEEEWTVFFSGQIYCITKEPTLIPLT